MAAQGPPNTPSFSSLRGPSASQKRARWHFARLGAVGALLAALLLEALFGLSGAGEYFHANTASVVMFHHAPEPEKATRARLGTGDIQLTLDWKGTTDLDLHCVDPFGQHIFFQVRQSRSGGRLDFDMNAGQPPWSSDSIENIFWPFGSAPVGEYVVYVHSYRRHGGPEQTPFHLRVLHRGQVDSIQGVASFPTAPDTNLSDPVNPAQPQEVFRFRIEAPPQGVAGLRPADWMALLACGLWVSLISVGLTAAILIGLNRWYAAHRPWALVPSSQSPRLLARSALWGAVHGVLAQAAFFLLCGWAVIALEAWRLLAWMLLSWWAGGRAGRLIPAHLPPRDGARGGLWGGASGGLAFAYLAATIPLALLAQADVPGRLMAAILIGACIGWQVRLPEPQPAPVPAAEPVEAPLEAAAPMEAPVEAPIPEPIPEPIPVPTIELRVMRSRGGRQMGGRALGGPRRHSGGRKARIGGEDGREED